MSENENLKIIADFMDLQTVLINGKWHCESKFYGLYELRYDSSYDWLMPVIEKISNCVIEGYPPFNSDQYVRVEIVPDGYVRISNLRDTPLFRSLSVEGSLLKALFLAAVDFVKWRNNRVVVTVKDIPNSD